MPLAFLLSVAAESFTMQKPANGATKLLRVKCAGQSQKLRIRSRRAIMSANLAKHHGLNLGSGLWAPIEYGVVFINEKDRISLMTDAAARFS